MHRCIGSQRLTLSIEYEKSSRHSQQVLAVIIPNPQAALGCEDRGGLGINAPVALAFSVSATKSIEPSFSVILPGKSQRRIEKDPPKLCGGNEEVLFKLGVGDDKQ